MLKPNDKPDTAPPAGAHGVNDGGAGNEPMQQPPQQLQVWVNMTKHFLK